eukprot:scaffold8569_cov139-Cylindrotheca_fusiformis.AAC.6
MIIDFSLHQHSATSMCWSGRILSIHCDATVKSGKGHPSLAPATTGAAIAAGFGGNWVRRIEGERRRRKAVCRIDRIMILTIVSKGGEWDSGVFVFLGWKLEADDG